MHGELWYPCSIVILLREFTVHLRIMSISHLSIRNFRSIVSLDQDVGDLNIFVGQNDEGKSNVLRALDLFFNDGGSGGYEFDWNRDYCSFATKRVQRAEEIEIGIVITPPASFAKRDPVVWKKTWRRDGFHLSTLNQKDGSEIAPKSKIYSFLKAMRFDYVPAIKSKDYFQTLMSKLHDMLEATVEEKVREASGAFTKTINENTKPILTEVLARLGLQTTIELPTNLRSLFAQLEFTSISAEKAFSLNQRGDGIKVRHIPIVLRWLAEQANHLSAPGRPKTVTVWGYEEPENNLELRRCFELAREFVDGSSQIQAFVTTHSPAFYSVFRDSDPKNVRLFLVTKDDAPPTTKVSPLAGDDDVKSLDTSMGLMMLLEPHFKGARRELEALRATKEKLTDTSIPTIFCEGPTDKRVLEAALETFYPRVAAKVAVRCSLHHGGGHTWVGEMMIAWSHSRPLAHAVGLFDQDADAKKSRKDANAKVKNAPSGKKVSAVELLPDDNLKACSMKHFKVPFAIEELYPPDVWDFAEGKGWLEGRKNPIALYGFSDPSVTFTQYAARELPEPHLRRLALQKVVLEHKEALAKRVAATEGKAERERVLGGLKATLTEVLRELGLT